MYRAVGDVHCLTAARRSWGVYSVVSLTVLRTPVADMHADLYACTLVGDGSLLHFFLLFINRHNFSLLTF